MALAKVGRTYDADMERLPGSLAANAIVRAMAKKGFAVVNAGPSPELLRSAQEEVRRLEDDLRFEPPFAEIVDGLLGEEGSARVCEIETRATSGEDFREGPSLQELDLKLSEVSRSIAVLASQHLGISFKSRSPGLLHLAGPCDEAPPELTEMGAQQWLDEFCNHKLMLLYFVGPGVGTLELEPFRYEDAPPHVVETRPGMLVIVRTDALLHRLTSPAKTTVLSCFVSQDTLDASRPDLIDETVVPCARELMRWILERIKQIKEKEVLGEDGPEWDPEVPRHWQSCMNHMFHKGPQTAFRSIACKLPSGWDHTASWSAMNMGADMLCEVPMKRWDHAQHYDPNPESWKWSKCYSRHVALMEGIELFDNKPFGISVFEAKGMEPNQRHILETSYEALIQAGYNKKKLSKALIGVFIGATQSEFVLVPVDEMAAGTSAAGAITSNRISFCLGMQGPSLTIDSGAAASLAAVSIATNMLRFQTASYQPCHATCAGGTYLCLHHAPMTLHCAAGWLSPEGRCLTFDATASGWAKGEGSGAVVQTRLTQQVDGLEVIEDGLPLLGVLGAITLASCGRGARLTAPSGPQQKEMLHSTLQQASIMPSDVEHVECHGDAGILSDALEVMAAMETLRGEDATPLSLGSSKTSLGHCQEVSGVVQLIKVVVGIRYGVQTTNLHLYELNQHIEVWDGESGSFLTEDVPYSRSSAFAGLTSVSITGTQVHAIPWGAVAVGDLREPRKQVAREAIAFWPAGGGELEDGAMPRKFFSIAGSWSEYRPERMEDEGGGVHGFTVTLGMNRFEHFSIMLDGDESQVLHPAEPNAGLYEKVEGPDSFSYGLCWMIDGATEWKSVYPMAERSGYEILDEDLAGRPGDRYRVRLHVAGQWRAVDWEKLAGGEEERAAYADDGRYYVVSTWNGWEFTQAMTADQSAPGRHTAEVKATGPGAFQIVRNQDWNQTFFPVDGGVAGPECWQPAGTNSWRPACSPGDVVFVELLRGKADPGDIRVSWRKVG